MGHKISGIYAVQCLWGGELLTAHYDYFIHRRSPPLLCSSIDYAKVLLIGDSLQRQAVHFVLILYNDHKTM